MTDVGVSRLYPKNTGFETGVFDRTCNTGKSWSFDKRIPRTYSGQDRIWVLDENTKLVPTKCEITHRLDKTTKSVTYFDYTEFIEYKPDAEGVIIKRLLVWRFFNHLYRAKQIRPMLFYVETAA